jgi:hypothetical protein
MLKRAVTAWLATPQGVRLKELTVGFQGSDFAPGPRCTTCLEVLR